MAVAMHSEESLLRRWRHAGEELRGLGSEAGGIAGDIRRIAKDEAKLALEETQDGIRAAKRAAIWAAIAGVFALLTLIWLPLPLFLGLAEAMPMWAASLITAGALLLVSLVLGALAMARVKRVALIPHGAIDRMKEDREWLSQHLSAGHD